MRQEFPKYEMIVEGESRFLSLHTAADFFDCGYMRVSIGRFVKESINSIPRPMMAQEEKLICELADKISANK